MAGISNISKEDYTLGKIEFVGELQMIINAWIKGNSARSMASLAQSAKVSEVSVRRLLNNHRKIVNEWVFNIISYIYDQDTFEGIAQALERDNKLVILDWFIRYYSYMKKYPILQKHKYIPLSDVVAANPMAFFVYNLTLVLDQVSREHFQKEFGEPAIAELDKLIKKKFLQEKDGVVSIRGDVIHLKFTKEQAASLLSELCKIFFKPDHDFNAQHLEVGTLSEDGYRDLRDFHLEFAAKIQTLYKTKSGNIPAISAGFSDTFTARPYFTNERESYENLKNSRIGFTKKQVGYLLSKICNLFFKVNQEFNSQHLEIGTLSEEGYGDLMGLHAQFRVNIQNLYGTKPGNIPVISAGFSDTFTSRPYFTDKGKYNGNP